MPDSFRLETESYTSGGLSVQRLDMAKHVRRLSLELDVQYDTAGSVTRMREGYAAQIINFLQIRDGGRVPLKIFGEDIYYLHMLLNKMPAGWSQVIETTSQDDQTVEHKFILPVELHKTVFTKPVLEIDWGTGTDIGTGYSIDLATINGTYWQSNIPPKGMKIIPNSEKSGVTGEQKIDVDPEGRLAWVLVIVRANASPFAPRNGLSTIDLKIEQSYSTYDADNLLQEFSLFTGQAEQTGCYLLKLDEKPWVGHNSRIIMNVDSTSSDIHVYFGFVSPVSPSESISPDIFGGGIIQAQVVTPSDVVARNDASNIIQDYPSQVTSSGRTATSYAKNAALSHRISIPNPYRPRVLM